jgi:transcriptional regulator with AAA-type ATPase domain
MLKRKMMTEQLNNSGVRLGDSCSILPFYGRKKAFTLKCKKIDIVSQKFRPTDLSLSYIELPISEAEKFHYRLELDQYQESEGRFVLKTIEGRPFWLNGLAAKEAYVERQDQVYIDDNKINFSPFGLLELTQRHFDHPILMQQNLIESDLKILITGETGTGKSHLAKKIHERSNRVGEFVAVNLSSFNPQLIESELFGHKKGSFTGAVSDKIGAFSMAQNGTLFLDEIDSLPLELQTKLLTFIDNKKFRRVGDVREETIRTRLIFASGRSLSLLVEQGLFRKDLYFRLQSGHSIELKSLRNDVNRIKDLCRYFCLENSVSITPHLQDLEKKKVLSRSLKLDFDQFDQDLILKSSDLMTLSDYQDIVPYNDFKKNYLKQVLVLCSGNAALAARKLQLNEKTVRSILQKV